jgi:hypothetical protein
MPGGEADIQVHPVNERGADVTVSYPPVRGTILGGTEIVNLGIPGGLFQPQRHAAEVVVDRHREVSQKVHPQQATIRIITRQIAKEDGQI